jgi:UDP-2,4-diacetamido-2,4,6-trideoxy-beta-L-altropyranose hydrolase
VSSHPERPLLLIRADANSRIGAGHVMRCIALGQEWMNNHGSVLFATNCASTALVNRLKNQGAEVIPVDESHPEPGDWRITSKVLSDYPVSWVVLDGYHFDAKYQLKIKDAGRQLLVIDDMAHLDHYHADILVNQNIHAHELHYLSEPFTQKLLGTDYVLLRKEFLSWKGYARNIPDIARNILVTMGGSDPDNISLQIIKALDSIEVSDLNVKVIIGPTNPHSSILLKAAEHSPLAITPLSDVDDMPELMAWADLAVSAGGSTCWELAFMGLPSLIIVAAENQRPIAEWLDTSRAVINLGNSPMITPSVLSSSLKSIITDAQRRALLSRQSQEIVDGNGASRVVGHMHGYSLRLRPVGPDDCRLVWEWANDPMARSASFSPHTIGWEEHLQWFNARMHDPGSLFYIAVDRQENPIGQIRYQIKDREATVSYTLDPGQRGKGFGVSVVLSGSKKLFENGYVDVIHAYVKQDNNASVQVFIKAGYQSI